MPTESQDCSIVFQDVITGETFECEKVVVMKNECKRTLSDYDKSMEILHGIEGSFDLNINTETKQEIYKFFIRLKEYTRLLRIYNRVTKIRTKKKLINRMDKLV